MLVPIPEKLDDKSLCLVTVLPDFTTFTADALGAAITDQDGFDALMHVVLTDLPAPGQVWQAIDDGITPMISDMQTLALDLDPELPHAVGSVAAALAYEWGNIAGIADWAGLGVPEDPLSNAEKQSLSRVPNSSGVTANDIVNTITARVIASLPRSTGGTSTSTPGSDTNTNPLPHTDISGKLPYIEPGSGGHGLISVDSEGFVSWHTSPTAQQPVSIIVAAAGESPQSFATGANGRQAAPFLLTTDKTMTFSLYTGNLWVDDVQVIGGMLRP